MRSAHDHSLLYICVYKLVIKVYIVYTHMTTDSDTGVHLMRGETIVRGIGFGLRVRCAKCDN